MCERPAVLRISAAIHAPPGLEGLRGIFGAEGGGVGVDVVSMGRGALKAGSHQKAYLVQVLGSGECVDIACEPFLGSWLLAG